MKLIRVNGSNFIRSWILRHYQDKGGIRPNNHCTGYLEWWRIWDYFSQLREFYLLELLLTSVSTFPPSSHVLWHSGSLVTRNQSFSSADFFHFFFHSQIKSQIFWCKNSFNFIFNLFFYTKKTVTTPHSKLTQHTHLFIFFIHHK